MKKTFFALFLALVMMLTLSASIFVTTAEETVKLTTTFELLDGLNYTIGALDVKDGDDRDFNDYILTSGLSYVSRPSEDPDDTFLWEVTKRTNGYLFKSVATGQYLNLTEDGLTLTKGASTLGVDFQSGYATIHKNSKLYLTFGAKGWAVSSNSADACEISFQTANNVVYDNSGEEALFSLACFSDLHVDYGIQFYDQPIRPSTVAAVTYLQQIGGADAIIVGGDAISGNDRSSGWTKSVYQKVRQTLYDTLAKGTEDGKVLFVTGNHDNEAGVHAGDNYYSGAYDEIMEDYIGAPTAALYYDDIDVAYASRYNEQLCFRYTFGGMEIIGINTPYRSERTGGFLYPDQIKWVSDQLKAIGKEKTVVLFCHYPATDIQTYPNGNAAQTELNKILASYPNVLYCYGHVHSGTDKYAWYNTNELVVPKGSRTLLENGAYETRTSHVCHMGSLGYYDTPFQPGGLTAQDPEIVQFLMIDFYKDHITFQYHNVGEKTADEDVRVIASYTVMRDVGTQFGFGDPNSDATGSDPTTDGVTDATSGGQGNSGSSAGLPTGALVVLILCGVVVVGAVAFLLWWFLAKNKKDKK